MAQFASPPQTLIASRLERVLVVDAMLSRGQFLADLMRTFKSTVRRAPTSAGGRAIAAAWAPQAIFLAHEEGGVDGVNFAYNLRRSDLPCRRAPVILQLIQPTSATILAGRDAGVHEFIIHPVSLGDLTRRLETAVLRPRHWIEAASYIGPDRRRAQAGAYRGIERRLMRQQGREEGVDVRPAL